MLAAATFLFAEGLVVGFIIPSLPAMILIAAVVGWLFLVVELLVAAPIWAVAHAYAEGEGFAPQQASYGYGAMIGVLMRPVAIVFGFAFSFYIIGIACWFASMALGTFLSGMLADVDIGPGAFVGISAIIVSTLFMVIRYTLRMITHLPDNLPRWMGGQGNNVGDAAAAESANAGAERGAGQAGRGVFALRQQAFKDSEGEAQRDASKIEDNARKAKGAKDAKASAAAEQKKHGEMMDALLHLGQGTKNVSDDGGGRTRKM